jgi:hypothetical protein
MDDNSRKRRQNDPSQYSTSDPRFSQDHGQGRSYATSSTDRFRAAPPMTTPPSAGRGVSPAGYTYYNEPAPAFPTALPASTMHYQPEYGPDQRQHQNFNSYNPNMMYNVNQQATPNAVYEAAQHFQPRQPAAMQLLSEATAPYYAGEPGNAPVAPILQHQPSTSSSATYHSPADRNPLLQGYSGSLLGMSGINQGHAEVMEEEEYASASVDQNRAGFEEAYTSYQNALKEIFQNIKNGILIEAGSSLLEVSDWLLSHVDELGEPPFTANVNKEALTMVNKGLIKDEAALLSQRIQLWEEFNTAWLALLQKQKDATLDYINGSPPRHPQSLIPHELLNKMAKELIRHCDNIEKHGLVDYQYGVWEERIITSKSYI